MDTLTEQQPNTKPPKKMKWYWHVFWITITICVLGGIELLFLRDIPLLLFLVAVVVLSSLPSDLMKPLPKEQRYSFRSFSVCFLGLIWVFSIWAIASLLVMFVIPPFSISPQTTYLTEPRSKEFYGIDYQAFIIEQLDPGVPPEDNGFRLLFETFGRSLFDDRLAEQHWQRICEYLDLPLDIEPTSTYTDWEAYQKTLSPEEREIVATLFQPNALLSEEAIPIIRQWLDENESALDLFVVASQMPVLYVPPMFRNSLFDTVYVNDNIGRTTARSLSVRIRYRLTTGSINEAWDDVLATYRLAEQHRKTVWCFVPVMLNNAILGMADRSAEVVVIHSDWDSDEILRRLDEIVPFQRQFSEDEIRLIFRNERLMAICFIQHIANEGFLFLDGVSHCCPPGRQQHKQGLAPMNAIEYWLKKRGARFSRLGLSMIEINQHFDNAEQRFFSNLSEPDYEWDYSTYELLNVFAWRGKFGTVGVMIGRVTSDLYFHSAQAYRDSFTSRQANAALTRLVFALEAYRRDKGNYPEALDNLLDDLLGHYIDEMPLDPFSGVPFRYIIEPEGYLLYSVGPNGIDEEGRGSGDTPRGDDIRRRMP